MDGEGGVSAGCSNKSRNSVTQKCIDGGHCVFEGCSNKSRKSVRGVWMVEVVYPKAAVTKAETVSEVCGW